MDELRSPLRPALAAGAPATLAVASGDAELAPVAAAAISDRTSQPDLGVPEAASVHELLRSLQGLGNEVRLRFLDALRMLSEGNLFFELGYSSFHQYCDRELGLSRSTSYEYLRVVGALDALPRTRALYGQGELSWEQVRSISRVASLDTEARWIELAFAEPVCVLLAEVREARRTGRDEPRDRRYGLPNLLVRLVLDLTLEEKERVRAAFELIALGLGPDLGGAPGDPAARDTAGSTVPGRAPATDVDRPSGESGRDPAAQPNARVADPRPPLVRWADGILSGAIPAWPTPVGGSPGADALRRAPAQTILYRMCPACREATLDTADGPVSVSPERVAELAPVANRVRIAPNDERQAEVAAPRQPDREGQSSGAVAGDLDAPNSPRLSRQVLHRDGLKCANPGCDRRRNLHAHHIVFRSRGGRTLLSNEVAVCAECHALLHKGLLEVTGSPDTGLQWQPRPVSPAAKLRDASTLRGRLRSLEAALEAAAESGIDCVTAPSSTGLDACGGGHESTAVDAYGRDGQQSTTVDDRACRHTLPARHDATPPSVHMDLTERVHELAAAVARFGYSRAESERRVRAAVSAQLATRPRGPERLRAFGPDEEAQILMRALRQ